METKQKPVRIDEIFKDDLIGDRRGLAERISNIIDSECNDKKGFVFTIDGRWGSGKTTFVEMLTNYLKDIQNYRVISFNCWERDFVDDPLIAMFAEMTNVVGKQKKGYRKFVNAFKKIALGAAVGATKAIVGDTANIISETTKGGLEATEECVKKYLDSYNKQVQSINDFKANLEDYIKDDNSEKKQVVFIIDELDRCNPHYAVKVLERIKHLFDIPNLFFILPICKSQLECAIQGYFGSERLDANVYLRRFIDLEIRLPIVNLYSFCEKALGKYGVMTCISNKYDPHNSHKVYEYISETAYLFEGTNTDLRTINKILCHVAKVMNGRYGCDDYQPILLMCYLKFNNKVLYEKISKQVLTVSELLGEFEKAMNDFWVRNPNEPIFSYTLKLVASVLFVYNRKVRESSGEQDEVTNIWSKLEKSTNKNGFDKQTIAEHYSFWNNGSRLNNLRMENIIRDIDNPLNNVRK